MNHATKERIFKRDNYICQSCRKQFKPSWEIEGPGLERVPFVNFLVVDHMEGREETDENLQTLCFRCNASKGGRSVYTHTLFSALRDFGRPIAFYPSIAKIIGMKECLLICQLIYWTPRSRSQKGQGWIYKTASELEDETGLTYKEQIRVRKRLGELSLLEEKYQRDEHTIYFRVNPNGLNILLEEHLTDGHMPNGHMPEGQMAYDETADGTCPKGISIERTENTQKLSETTERESRQEPLSIAKSQIIPMVEALHLEMDTIPFLKRAWGEHPKTKRLKWPRIERPLDVASQEAAAGKEDFRESWLRYLDEDPEPNLFAFLRLFPQRRKAQKSNFAVTGSGNGQRESRYHKPKAIDLVEFAKNLTLEP